MIIDPDPVDAQTPADIVTPHEDSERQPTGNADPDINPGIEDPRHSRMGPEILDPPPHGLPPKEDA